MDELTTDAMNITGKTITDYANARIDTGLAKLPPTLSAEHDHPNKHEPPYQGNIASNKTLLDQTRPVLRKMSRDPQIRASSTPTLFHPDLHKRNIFVSDEDPGLVTAIIDWQGSAVEPAFWYRWDVPDFCGRELVRPFDVPPGEEDVEFVFDGDGVSEEVRRGCEEVDLEARHLQEKEALLLREKQAQEGDGDQAGKRQEQQQEQEQEGKEQQEQEQSGEDLQNTFISLIHKTITHKHIPTLTAPTYAHENIYRPFIVPSHTWSKGLPELEHELIELHKDWTSLGFQGKCPFPVLSAGELEKHAEEYEEYKDVVRMREEICQALCVGEDGGGWIGVNEDGFDVWEERVKANREMCRAVFDALREDGEVVDKEGYLRAVWPFDVML